VVHNAVANPATVARGFAAGAGGQLAAPWQLVALRLFRLEVGVGTPADGGVDNLGAGGAEGLCIGQGKVVVRVQMPSQRGAVGAVAAELLVLVVASSQFGGKCFALVAVLDEQATVPT